MKISPLEYQRRYDRLGQEIYSIFMNCESSDHPSYLDLLRARIDSVLWELLKEGILIFRPLYNIKEIVENDDLDIDFDPDHLERCFGEVDG